MTRIIRNDDYYTSYDYYDDVDMLHYGRKGQKWGQNIFEKAKVAGSRAYGSARNAARQAYNSNAGIATRYHARQAYNAGRTAGRVAKYVGRQAARSAYNTGRQAASRAREYGSQAASTAKLYGKRANTSLLIGASTIQDYASTKLSRLSSSYARSGSRFLEQSDYLNMNINNLQSSRDAANSASYKKFKKSSLYDDTINTIIRTNRELDHFNGRKQQSDEAARKRAERFLNEDIVSGNWDRIIELEG